MSTATTLIVSIVFSILGCAHTEARTTRAGRPVPALAKAVVRTAKTYLAEEDKRRQAPRDCSDFVGKVFAENGMRLPRTASAMSQRGGRVRSSYDLRMGDLVFFSGEHVSHRRVGHVGIYVNNGIFIHLSKKEAGVTMESLYSDYYRRRYITARRIIQ